MNIIYIAYSCSPYHGSEDKIGWNVSLESAKTNRVFVITKEEQREYIEDYLRKNTLENISFHYVDIPGVYKHLFSGPMYSGRLNIWNRSALVAAKKICESEKIEIIHQITPLEFRSIGNYGSIPGVKFVCGPIGGGQKLPKELLSYLDVRQRGIEALRSVVNTVSIFLMKCVGRMKNCDFLLFANKETEQYMKNCVPADVQTERLVDISSVSSELINIEALRTKQTNRCRLLVIGRLVYLKGHVLLMDALSQLPPDLEYSCMIIGDGCEREKLMEKCSQLGLDNKITFCGAVPHERIQCFCDASDALIFPSIRETSGAVILEAMTRGLPVVALNMFGAAIVLDRDTGWLCNVDSKDACVENLKNAIQECVQESEKRLLKGYNARIKAEAYTWEKRVEYYQSIYESLVKAENE